MDRYATWSFQRRSFTLARCRTTGCWSGLPRSSTTADLGPRLRAGIPAVIIPHIIDQFIWGQRVYELSAGPKPVPRTKLTAENLRQALEQAFRDEHLRQSAAALGEKIRAENGVQQAIRLILSG